MKRITQKNHKNGFTIVETLVAITVLMIAISGPLVVASKGLFGATLSKNQMIASYLAQESMEVVKNKRDNNISSGAVGGWLGGLGTCTNSSPCDAGGIGNASGLQLIIPCSGAPCQIYVRTYGYSHANSSSVASPFTRKFYIHAPNSVNPCTTDECGVTVEVYWNEAQLPYSVVMTSEITNTLR